MRIGIIGAGMIGSTLAKLWVDAGHEVRIASRHPEQLQSVVERLGARASAGKPIDAAAFGEVVMLTVPLKAVPDLARDLAPALAERSCSTPATRTSAATAPLPARHPLTPRVPPAWAAAMFPSSRWVKAFNTVYFKTLEREAHRKGERVGIPLASDDAGALDTAAALVRDAGFDPVVVGGLARGKEFEPDTAPYNTGVSGQQLRSMFGL